MNNKIKNENSFLYAENAVVRCESLRSKFPSIYHFSSEAYRCFPFFLVSRLIASKYLEIFTVSPRKKKSRYPLARFLHPFARKSYLCEQVESTVADRDGWIARSVRRPRVLKRSLNTEMHIRRGRRIKIYRGCGCYLNKPRTARVFCNELRKNRRLAL